MNQPASTLTTEPPPSRSHRLRSWIARHQAWLAPLLLVLITAMAYAPAPWGTFVLDDRSHLYESDRLQSIWPVEKFMGRRGLMDFTFAINYMIDGVNPRGYHIFNVIIHMLAGLFFYGLMRQLLRLPQWPEALKLRARPIAIITAGLWLVHPLLTQAVTYVIQRGESMMGMFVLAAAWALVRCAISPKQPAAIAWGIASVLCMAMAVWTKESAVTMPIALLLLDALVLTGRIKLTMRKRWWLHAGLIATMALPLMGNLGELQVNPVTAPTTATMLQQETGQQAMARVTPPVHVIPSTMTLGHYPTAGFGMPGMTWQQYFFTQPAVITQYLWRSVWPSYLSIEHHWRPMRTPWGQWRAIDLQLSLAFIVTLAVLSLWLLWRRPWLGVTGCWFFLSLGVTSSFIPINDVAVEHRMYLAMAAVIVAFVLGAWWLGWMLVSHDQPGKFEASQRLLASVACVMIVMAGVRTFVRNLDYRSELAIWQAAADGQQPNSRILMNLGSSLYQAGFTDQAAAMYRQTLDQRPGDFNALLNLGNISYNRDRDLPTAIHYYRLALRMVPDSPIAMTYLARAYTQGGQYDQAIELLQRATARRPDDTAMLTTLGSNYFRQGDYEQALRTYEKVHALSPSAANWGNMGMAYVAQGQLAQATSAFTQALAIDDRNAALWEQLARNLARQKQHRQALEALERAITLEPTMERSMQLAMLLSHSPDATLRDLPRARQIVQQGLTITRQQDPRWLETAAKVALADNQPRVALAMELRAFELAKQRGAPAEVLSQAQAEIDRLRSMVHAMRQSDTSQPAE